MGLFDRFKSGTTATQKAPAAARVRKETAPTKQGLTAGGWLSKGDGLTTHRRYQEALQCFDNALEIDPQYADAWIRKGAALCDIGRDHEGLQCYDRALEIDPKDAGKWAAKGAALNRLNRYQEAIQCCDKALEINSKNASARYVLSLMGASRDKPDEEPDVWDMNEKKDVNGLIKALEYKAEPDRRNAADFLGRIGDPRAVDPLIERLNDPEWTVRADAAEALGKINSLSAVDPLIERLNDSEWLVRRYAAEALGRIRDPRAVDPLMVSLRDEVPQVQGYSGNALVQIGAPAVEPLIRALGDSEQDIRWRAALALSEIGDVRAVEPLIRVWLGDEERRVSNMAFDAIRDLRDPSVVEQLIKAFETHPLDKDRVTFQLVQIGAPAVEPLTLALGSKDDNIRAGAKEALDKIEAAKKMTWFDKGVALYGLGRYEEALPCFDKALEIDPKDATIQTYKRKVLEEIRKTTPQK